MKGTVLNAYDVVAHITESNPNIESIILVTYVEGPNWRDLPRTEKGAGPALLRKGLSQDQGRRILTEVPRSEVSAANLYDIAQSLGDNRLLGICSKIRLIGGGTAHIPMMDFMCSASTTSLELITHLIEALRQGQGSLLDSGRSYHYYGFQLLTEEKWKVFLGKCLLMSGFADDRYIGHQLVDGHCVLRLSSGKSKTRVPKVILELH